MKNARYGSRYAGSHALVIGINRYRYVSQLSCACADGESVADVLIAELGFPKANVTRLLDEDATKQNILSRFAKFDSLSSEDRLLIFFAGHGKTTNGHRGPVGHLVPVDGRSDDLSTLIAWRELTEGAELIPAKHILFLMDACYSGLAMQRFIGKNDRRFVSDMLQRFSRQVITAGKSDETVADGGGPAGKNSIFTGHLLEGLSGNASNEHGVLTASYLLDYVYRNVANDSKSRQTPHGGHLDGEGDFILRTPNGEHLPGGPEGNFIVQPIPERPEPVFEGPVDSIKPIFAKKNGYADPESDTFGRNEWSKKIGLSVRGAEAHKVIRPTAWLALVVEPVSNLPVRLDLANLAKTLPNQRSNSEKQWERFRIPSQSITTSKSVILSDEEYNPSNTTEEVWKRYVRIEESGAIEYCDPRVAVTWAPVELASGRTLFQYTQIIGLIWTFLYAAKRILATANYHGGIRYLVNIIGTMDSVLIGFASREGPDRTKWTEPLGPRGLMNSSLQNWKCRDVNLQTAFTLVLAGLGEAEAKQLIVECASFFGRAYNHKSPARCFVHGTAEFPWEEFRFD